MLSTDTVAVNRDSCSISNLFNLQTTLSKYVRNTLDLPRTELMTDTGAIATYRKYSNAFQQNVLATDLETGKSLTMCKRKTMSGRKTGALCSTLKNAVQRELPPFFPQRLPKRMQCVGESIVALERNGQCDAELFPSKRGGWVKKFSAVVRRLPGFFAEKTFDWHGGTMVESLAAMHARDPFKGRAFCDELCNQWMLRRQSRCTATAWPQVAKKLVPTFVQCKRVFLRAEPESKQEVDATSAKILPEHFHSW